MRSVNRVFFSLLLVIAALVLLAGCGGGCSTTSFGSTGSGSGGSKAQQGTACGPGSGGPGGPAAAFVYYLGASDVEVASLSTTGAFTTVTGLTPPTLAGSAIDDMTVVSGKFLYLPFGDVNSVVQALSINHATGGLTSITGSPFALTPTGAAADTAVADPLGRFLFVGSEISGSISVFKIDATTGALTEAPGSPFTSFNLFSADSVTVDGTGKFLYAGQLNFSTPLAAFSIDQNTGALSEIAGSPFNMGVAQLHADPSGKFLLGVAEIQDAFGLALDQHIHVMAIDATTGALSEVAGSPFPTTSAPFDFVISPNGKFVYVQGNDPGSTTISAIEGYQLDPTTGALTALSGSPFASLPTATQCKFDQSGAEMFCATSAGFSVLTADPNTGALTHTVPDLAVSNFPFAVTN
jgi:6-phosphogluconolactonase